MSSAREVFGPQRETPALMEGADQHAPPSPGGGGAPPWGRTPQSYPPNPGEISEIPWDFFLTVPPGGARAGRARRGAGVVVLSFLGHGMAGES